MGALAVILKTGMVFGLLAAVLFVLKKTDGLGGRARGGLLEVRGSTRLGKGATLTAVRVDGRDLLLGVTEHNVTLLTSEAAPLEADEPTSRKPALLDALRLPGLRPSTNLSPDAVAAALASLRGENAPPATDGSVAARSRGADRRRVARTDARPDEEQTWSRACRPTFRTADGDDALV